LSIANSGRGGECNGQVGMEMTSGFGCSWGGWWQWLRVELDGETWSVQRCCLCCTGVKYKA